MLNKHHSLADGCSLTLAHPNNGKYPAIERGLLESSPQLMFNEGGAVSFTIKHLCVAHRSG